MTKKDPMTKTGKPSDIDEDLVRKLARLLDETGLSEIEYGKDDWHVRVAKGTAVSTVAISAPKATIEAAPAAIAVSVQDADATQLADHPGAVKSPMVGIAYRSKDQTSPPFVQEGANVNKGDTLLLIEAMKVFNP
ncbi:MAG: acetyl-CoA carboxylase biotin carboxyl carrier protein, partial [Alphaproteobacteria bacterium]|nr:acetyl-CoA carboxylase biotin carboxyl carrier protein [Alphaproteobacteria bacterium]